MQTKFPVKNASFVSNQYIHSCDEYQPLNYDQENDIQRQSKRFNKTIIRAGWNTLKHDLFRDPRSILFPRTPWPANISIV